MVSNVKVKVANATALLVSWDNLQDSYLSHYTIYYSAFSPLLSKVVDKFTKVISSTNTSDIVNIKELRAGVEHQFQVTASLEIEEVYEGVKSVPAKMVFGKAQAMKLCISYHRLSLCVYACERILQMKQYFSFKWDL